MPLLPSCVAVAGVAACLLKPLPAAAQTSHAISDHRVTVAVSPLAFGMYSGDFGVHDDPDLQFVLGASAAARYGFEVTPWLALGAELAGLKPYSSPNEAQAPVGDLLAYSAAATLRVYSTGSQVELGMHGHFGIGSGVWDGLLAWDVAFGGGLDIREVVEDRPALGVELDLHGYGLRRGEHGTEGSVSYRAVALSLNTTLTFGL